MFPTTLHIYIYKSVVLNVGGEFFSARGYLTIFGDVVGVGRAGG